MKKILVPIDGSDGAKDAVKRAKEFAKAFNANITLLYVKEITTQESLIIEPSRYIEIVNEMSEKILNEAEEILSDLSPSAEIVSIDGYPAQAIISYIQDNDVDLVIMGSKGLSAGRIQKALIGSVTSKVMHAVDIPILVVK